MKIKIFARKCIKQILEWTPKPMHRYLLSCYQQVPRAFLGTGYEVLLNLKETSEAVHASSFHYFKNHPVLQRMCSGFESGVIFDVGANIGQTAVAYREIFPKASIYAFEPFRENFEHLSVNTKDSRHIKSYQYALSDYNGTLEVKRDLHPLSQWNSICRKQQENLGSTGNFISEIIQSITGDLFCERENINSIALLKIDTEGHEIEVLKGFQNMISKGRVYSILLEAGFSGDTNHGGFQDINQFMLEQGMILDGVYDPDYHRDGGSNFINALYFRPFDKLCSNVDMKHTHRTGDVV